MKMVAENPRTHQKIEYKLAEIIDYQWYERDLVLGRPAEGAQAREQMEAKYPDIEEFFAECFTEARGFPEFNSGSLHGRRQALEWVLRAARRARPRTHSSGGVAGSHVRVASWSASAHPPKHIGIDTRNLINAIATPDVMDVTDVYVASGGMTLALVTPETEAAREWIREHVTGEQSWFGRAGASAPFVVPALAASLLVEQRWSNHLTRPDPSSTQNRRFPLSDPRRQAMFAALLHS